MSYSPRPTENPNFLLELETKTMNLVLRKVKGKLADIPISRCVKGLCTWLLCLMCQSQDLPAKLMGNSTARIRGEHGGQAGRAALQKELSLLRHLGNRNTLSEHGGFLQWLYASGVFCQGCKRKAKRLANSPHLQSGTVSIQHGIFSYPGWWERC